MIEKKKKSKKLLEKENQFIHAYFALGLNATKAYMQVYPNAKYDSARAKAAVMLAKDSVSEAIQKKLDESWEDRDKKISHIFNSLYSAATADIGDYVDENGEIKAEKLSELNTLPIQQYDRTVSDTKEGQNVKTSIKLMDKIKAMQELNKIFGIINEKVEHSGTIEIVPAVRPGKEEE